MPGPSSHKITADHLNRRACLYIRQSSLHQVQTHKESQHRQYDLRRRAIALGWPEDRIDVIDEDQGKSGATSTQRMGFQDLRARVGAGEVGMVLSLEVSRLCRDNAEWHQLLRIAAVAKTLILDEHGIYDVGDINDWMLLGLKGQLSEYELRGIRARMVGGQRSKALRGELKLHLPIGLAYIEADRVVLDPDQSITEAIALVFTTFRRLGSAMQVTKWFWRQAIRLPSRPHTGNSEVHWAVPNYSQIQRILHNPRYAGCYAYGRTGMRTRPDGSVQRTSLPIDQWLVCIRDAHKGYIDWEEYLHNQETMRTNAASYLGGAERTPPPRKGVALLQSRIICGLCGQRMHVNYNYNNREDVRWYYLCKENIVRRGTRTCQSMRGDVLDAAVGRFVVAAVNRENLTLSLTVREQLRSDFEAADRQRINHIESLRYQVDLARRRYMEVDPSNRLVSATLEAEWEARLKAHGEAVREQERYKKAQHSTPDAALDQRILALASDFGTVWEAAHTTNKDRKRLLGLLIEDITLTRRGYQVNVGLRLRGGRTHELPPVALPLPRATVIRRDASKQALAELEELLEAGYDDSQAAEELNLREHRDSLGGRFNAKRIRTIRVRHKMPGGIERQREKMRAQGYKTAKELAAELAIDVSTVGWRAREGRGIDVHQIPASKRTFAMYRISPKIRTTATASS